jgi:choline dehydrogenase-like flavoprotein
MNAVGDLQADVLIVGAGPSGAVVAHTLASRGFSVVCLEQGDWVNPGDLPGGKPEFELLTRTAWHWEPNVRGRREDYPLELTSANAPVSMFGAVGGSSVVYGAHWQRLMPSDFRLRTLDGVADDWPIGYEDLKPYYDRVDAFIGVAGLGGDPAYPPQDFPLPPHPLGAGGVRMGQAMNKLGWHFWPGTQAIPSTAFKNMAQCVRWGVCERGCPAGAKASFDLAYWPHASAAGARLVTNARVSRITVGASGLADGVIWLDPEGGGHRVRANAVVLAANGIGTPRLLLMSDDVHAEGLANSSGLVGKNLMIHPNRGVIGVYDENMESWNGPAGQLIYSLEFYETDESRGFVRGAKWNLMPIPGVLNVLNLYRHRPFEERWGKAAHALSRRSGRALVWYANIDDLPEETNTVTLDPELRDSSGLPAPKVTYTLSENSIRNLDFSAEKMTEAHLVAGAVDTFLDPLVPSGHLLGTARMGNDPATSVVDAFGRSHDIPNLFVVDGSVMVTGGAMNPTSTITAFALRAAEHIAGTASELPAQV